MPLLDRAIRMMLRNLKALDDRRRPPAPNLNIGSAGQVNVGQHQVNVSDSQADPKTPSVRSAGSPSRLRIRCE